MHLFCAQCIYMRVHMYMSLCSGIYVHMYVYAYVYASECMYSYVYICICVCMCIYTVVNTSTSIRLIFLYNNKIIDLQHGLYNLLQFI